MKMNHVNENGCKRYDLIGYLNQKDRVLEPIIIKQFVSRQKAIKYLNDYLVFDEKKNVVIDPELQVEYLRVILVESLFDFDCNNKQ